jgi:hypothetical protein
MNIIQVPDSPISVLAYSFRWPIATKDSSWALPPSTCTYWHTLFQNKSRIITNVQVLYEYMLLQCTVCTYNVLCTYTFVMDPPDCIVQREVLLYSLYRLYHFTLLLLLLLLIKLPVVTLSVSPRVYFCCCQP